MAPGESMKRIAYLTRLYEYGADHSKGFGPDAECDIVTDRIGGIADALGL